LNFQIFNTLVATKIFHKDAGAFGLLGSVLALGSLAAAIVSTRLDQRRKPIFILSIAIVFGLVLMISAWMPTYLTYAVALPICGFLAVTTMISANTYVQTTTPQELRGRVMGFYVFIFLGSAPIGSPIIGWLSDSIGIRETVTFCGAVTSIGTYLIYYVMKNKLTEHQQEP
jgi:MFS family permease